MSGAENLAAAFEEDVGDANAVLLLAPSMDPADGEGCGRLLTRSPIEEENVLGVTLTDTPDDRMAAWQFHFDGQPAKLGFVGVGDPARSTAATNGTVDVPGQSIRVESVNSPGDLTGLGMRITELLSQWDGDENDTVLCFHSLTSLLQYVELQQAFRFLHVLTGRLDAIGAVGHFHMDPTAHTEREVNTLKTLFDAVVEFRDGEWVVSSR